MFLCGWGDKFIFFLYRVTLCSLSLSSVHFQTAKWIRSAAVLKLVLEPDFSSALQSSCIFVEHMYLFAHTRALLFYVHVHFAFSSFSSTVLTQSQHLWDYQSPFVFRREPSWLGGGLRWEPSGLYSKQLPLYLPFPLSIVSKPIHFKEKRDSKSVWNFQIKAWDPVPEFFFKTRRASFTVDWLIYVTRRYEINYYMLGQRSFFWGIFFAIMPEIQFQMQHNNRK